MENIAALMNGLKHDETAAILFTGEMDDGRKVRVVVRPRHRFMGGFVEGEAARWVRVVRTVRFGDGVNTFGLERRGTGEASTWVTAASDVHVVSGRNVTRAIHTAIDAWMRAGQVREFVSRFGLGDEAAWKLARDPEAVVVAGFDGGKRFFIDPLKNAADWVPMPWCDDVVETSVDLDESISPACVVTTDSAGVRRCYFLDDARVKVMGLREFVALIMAGSQAS